jgi:hypothetical protein
MLGYKAGSLIVKKKRKRYRMVEPLEVRLQRFADEARASARAMPAGIERDLLLRKVEQTENALEMNSSLGGRHAPR